MMTNVNATKTLTRISTILAGRNKTPPTLIEQTLCIVAQIKSKKHIGIINEIRGKSILGFIEKQRS